MCEVRTTHGTHKIILFMTSVLLAMNITFVSTFSTVVIAICVAHFYTQLNNFPYYKYKFMNGTTIYLTMICCVKITYQLTWLRINTLSGHHTVVLEELHKHYELFLDRGTDRSRILNTGVMSPCLQYIICDCIW